MPAPSRSTLESPLTPDNRAVALASSWRISLSRVVRRETIIGWLFVSPALLMYAVFVLLPLLLSIQYSFFRWNGVGPATWVGLSRTALASKPITSSLLAPASARSPAIASSAWRLPGSARRIASKRLRACSGFFSARSIATRLTTAGW